LATATGTSFLADTGSSTTPAYGWSGQSNTGFYFATGVINVTTAGSVNSAFNSLGNGGIDTNQIRFDRANADVVLTRDAANTLAQRNGVNAQALRVYGTYTDASNYERLAVVAGAAYEIQAQNAGTGSARSIQIKAGTGAGFFFGGNAAVQWQVNASGHLITQADNAYDIGASGATRPRTGYFGTSLETISFIATAAGSLSWSGRSRIQSATNGQLRISTNNGSDFSLLIFGDNTSSFPALKRSSAILQARLADDSAFAPLQGQLRTDTNYTAGDPATTGYLVIYDATGTAYRVPALLN
jgi:hypothetical protein